MSIYDNIDFPTSPQNITVSNDCLELIQYFEGMKLKAYQDTGGVWTIGIGHTKTAKAGMVIDEEQAFNLLREDIKEAEYAVRNLVVPSLYQHQYDALVSFTFNLGYGNFSSSTLLTVVNDENHIEVPNQLNRWVYDNGKELNGLVRRRIAEGLLYTGKEWKRFEDVFQQLKG